MEKLGIIALCIMIAVMLCGAIAAFTTKAIEELLDLLKIETKKEWIFIIIFAAVLFLRINT
jgi:hypothetical protein